jgi:hypothetical protein
MVIFQPHLYHGPRTSSCILYATDQVCLRVSTLLGNYALIQVASFFKIWFRIREYCDNVMRSCLLLSRL